MTGPRVAWSTETPRPAAPAQPRTRRRTPTRAEQAAAMSWPAVCRHCHHLHDAGKAPTVQRYTDCSVWRCPGCGVLIDDRPFAWGGSLVGEDARVASARWEGIR